MKAEKNPRKNPSMGTVDAGVTENGAREAYQEAVDQGRAPADPTPAQYQVYVDARPAPSAEPTQTATATAAPFPGLLAMVKKVPWWGWVAAGFASLFVASVIADANEKKPKTNRTSKNRVERDGPYEDEDLDDDPDEDEDEESNTNPDEDSDSDDESDDSDADEDDEDLDDGDDIDEDEDTEDHIAPKKRIYKPRKPRKKPERVIGDDAPEQNPAESVVDGASESGAPEED